MNKTTPLFPGYLFMGTGTDLVPWKSVNATNGVAKAVKLDNVYRPINTYIIDGLMHRCDVHGVIQSINDIFPGDRVKIERGLFSDFVCSIDEIVDSVRVWVLIELMQQQTRAKILIRDLSKSA